MKQSDGDRDEDNNTCPIQLEDNTLSQYLQVITCLYVGFDVSDVMGIYA